MIRSVICMLACNKYASSPLSGCVEDASAIYNMLRNMGWEGPSRIQFDDKVKNQDIRDAVDWFVTQVNTGKYTNALLCVSGHGTSIPVKGREDPTKEIFCPYDIDTVWNSPDLVSDEFFEEQLNRIDKSLAGKVKVDFLALCCNSGGLTTTQVDDSVAAIEKEPTARIRYLRGPWEAGLNKKAMLKKFEPSKRNVFVDDSSVWSYRSAANSIQYSYEVSSPTFGKGDVSRIALIESLKKQPDVSWADLHKKAQLFIDTNFGFDQTPQLWVPSWRLDNSAFC